MFTKELDQAYNCKDFTLNRQEGTISIDLSQQVVHSASGSGGGSEVASGSGGSGSLGSEVSVVTGDGREGQNAVENGPEVSVDPVMSHVSEIPLLVIQSSEEACSCTFYKNKCLP